MISRCMSACFCVFVVASGLFHLAEFIINAIFAYYLWHDPLRSDWSTVVIGLLLLPLVMIQLMSAVLLLQRKGEQLSFGQISKTAFLHFFQLGFLWRHVIIVIEKNEQTKKKDLLDLCLLHVIYAFLAGLPLLTVQTFVMFYYTDSDWLILSSASSSLLASSWAIASFRQQYEKEELKNIILTWPGILFQLIWRIGEILMRLISIAVFAILYEYWTFLVFALHFLTMFVCICISGFGVFHISDKRRCTKVFFYAITAYMYSFCYMNFNDKNICLWSFTYYIIMFLENSVLVAVWLLNVHHVTNGTTYLILFIALSAYFVAMVSMIIYYKFFHIPISDNLSEKRSRCFRGSCINCKLSMCVKHNLKLQRPFSEGWLIKYQEALYQGQYYKHFLQDSIFDSLSEWNAESSSDASSEDEDLKNGKFIGRLNRKNVSEDYIQRQSVETYTREQMTNTDSESASSVGGASSDTCSTSDSQSDYSDIDSCWGMSDVAMPETKFIQVQNEINRTLFAKSNEYLLENGSQFLYEIFQTAPMLGPKLFRQRILKLSEVVRVPPSSSMKRNKRHNVSMTSSSAESAICGSSDVTDVSNKCAKVNTDCDVVISDHEESLFVNLPSKRKQYDGHSESEDSAFPQENLSSVNGTSVVTDDACSESSIEMII